MVPWLPPLNSALQAAFRRVSPALGLLWLVAGQAVAPGLACAVAGTSLARARRPANPGGRPGAGRLTAEAAGRPGRERSGIAAVAHWLPK